MEGAVAWPPNRYAGQIAPNARGAIDEFLGGACWWRSWRLLWQRVTQRFGDDIQLVGDGTDGGVGEEREPIFGTGSDQPPMFS